MVVLTIAMLALAAPFQGAQPLTYAGRPVADVLQQLQGPELKIIFSTDLVPSTLRVRSEPTSKDPKEIATQILAPHGLALQPGPRGTLLVVALPRKDPPESPPRKPAAQPPPPQRPSGEPAAPPAPVRIEEEVNVIDRLGEAAAVPSVYTVRPAQVRETPGTLDNVLLTLPLLPGVAAVNDEDGKIAVRGAGPEHNLIVIDGVQIHNPLRFGEWTSSFVNPATLASVTLDASGLDARHGGRLSSVTIFETREGNRSRRLSVSGSAGLTNGDVLLEGRVPGTEAGAWWATARGTYYRAVSDRVTDGVEPGFVDLQAKVDFRPSARTRLSIFGLAGRETMRELRPRQDRSGEVTAFTTFEGDSGLGMMNLTWNPNRRLVATTTMAAYVHEERFVNDDLSIRFPPFDRSAGVTDLSLRQRALYAFSPRHVLDAGVDLHRIDSDWRMRGMLEPVVFRGLGPSTLGEQIDYAAGPIDASVTRTQAGFWLQDRLPIGGRVIVEPGVRLDWNSFTGEAAWQPRLRVTTRAARATVWAGAAMQVQTPSHEALQGLDYFHITQASGSQLRNERSRQAVVGVASGIGAGFDVRIEAYYRRFDRLLVQRLESETERASRLSAYEIPPDLPPDAVILERRPTIHPESTGRGGANGLEVLLERRSGRVTGWISYTLSRATRESHGFTSLYDYDRPHALAAVAMYQVARRVRASATTQFASGFPYTPTHEEVRFGRLENVSEGTIDPILRSFRRADGSLRTDVDASMRRVSLRNTERLRPYSRTDMRLTYATLGHWEFYSEVINVFDQPNHQETVVFVTTGGGGRRSIYHSFGRMYTFGIRALF